MLKNYLKIAWRNLKRNKTYTTINILGLTLGITCALVIFLIIRFGFSFDTYQPDAKNTYHVVIKFRHKDGTFEHDTGVPYPLPKAFANYFAPYINYSSIIDVDGAPNVVSVKQPDGTVSRFSLHKQNIKGAMVNQSYFDMFSYQWIEGNLHTALKQPNTVVLTQYLAKLFFGSKNPMGKLLTFGKGHTVKVTGVVKDPPPNTDMPFKLFGRSVLSKQQKKQWHSVNDGVQYYFTLKKGASIATVKKGLKQFVDSHFGFDAKPTHLILQPLLDVHFNNAYFNFNHRSISKITFWILGIIGLVILLLACFNFINLNIALAVNRGREVGVRKVLGSSRLQIVLQFLIETASLVIVSTLLSVAFTKIVVVHLKPLFGYNLQWHYFNNPTLILFLIGIVIFVTLAAGLYPALKLSGYNPVNVMTNIFSAGRSRGFSLRKGLTVSQFAISQILIIAVLIIWSQLHFMNTKDMGFNPKNVIEVSLPSDKPSKINTLRGRLLQHPEIRDVSFSNTGTASNNGLYMDFTFHGKSSKKQGHEPVKVIDQHYLKTYGLHLLAGHVPHNAMADSATGFLVNQAFVKKVGHGKDYAAVIGREMRLEGISAPIVGVVHNFNTKSLRHKIRPVIMVIQDRYMVAAIKVAGGQTHRALEDIKKEWLAAFPGHVFDYSFLQNTIKHFYKKSQKTAGLITVFAIIAIIIDCLGLFGLISYMAANRTKEVGIRKVLGATIPNILGLFYKEVVLLVGVAFIVTIPIAYYLMHKWLTNFAYRIHIVPGIFIITLAISATIALATVSWQSIRAALANPTDSLRSE
jgi:ABC-type antimicrobial peptide transport system permease subunit